MFKLYMLAASPEAPHTAELKMLKTNTAGFGF